MEATSTAEIHKALATRLANRDIPDKVLASVAERVSRNGLKVGKVDFCPYGICIDYFTADKISIDELIAREKYRAVKLFPYGILVDDLFRVQVEMSLQDVAEQGQFR